MPVRRHGGDDTSAARHGRGRGRGHRARCPAATVTVVAAVVGLLGLGPARAQPAAAAPGHRPPNIVFVLTDDLDVSEASVMARTLALIGKHGATFDNAFVSNSLCCPSRTTILRGQYAHNTGVLSNGGAQGGFQRAYRLGDERDTIATRLHDAGYLTGLFGKYLNQYPRTADKTYIPPGWTSWASPVAGHPYAEYDYTLNVDGARVRHGNLPEDYGTGVYFGLADQFVQRAASARRPFFLSVDPFVPHTPAIPAPEDERLFPDAIAPRTPAFDLPDVSAKPAFIRDLPHFTPQETDAIDKLYRRRLRTLQAVDRGVERLVMTLRQNHLMKNTYFVFTSDNGYHLGQNRLPAGKGTAYDTDTHVPLLVRGPGITPGRHVTGFVLNTDFAPTFAAIAGTRSPATADGRSLLPALVGSGSGGTTRQSILIEHWRDKAGSTSPRGVVTEPEDPDEIDPALNPSTLPALSDQTVFRRLVKIPTYAGIRTRDWLFVAYADGERELYDLRADPDQVHNLHGQVNPAIEAALETRLDVLVRCRGTGCRRAENHSVP